MPAVNTQTIENITMTPDGRCRVVHKDGKLETITVGLVLWKLAKDMQSLAAENATLQAELQGLKNANPSKPSETTAAEGAILKRPDSSQLSPVIYDEHGPAMPGYQVKDTNSNLPFGTGWPG